MLVSFATTLPQKYFESKKAESLYLFFEVLKWLMLNYVNIVLLALSFRTTSLRLSSLNSALNFWPQAKFLPSKCISLLLRSKPVQQNCLYFFKDFKTKILKRSYQCELKEIKNKELW